MDLKHFRLKLRKKQSECQTALTAFETEARVAGEVRDTTDNAAVSQGVSEAFEEGTIVSQTLEEVQDALRRVANGTYGRCIACGREIDPVRLEAISWAARCVEDQEKQDNAPLLQAGR